MATCFFFRGNRSTNSIATESTTAYVPDHVTLATTGALNQGAITVRNWYTPTLPSIAYTGSGPGSNATVRGYNLVGEPLTQARSTGIILVLRAPLRVFTGQMLTLRFGNLIPLHSFMIPIIQSQISQQGAEAT